MSQDKCQEFQEIIRKSFNDASPITIQGGDSKSFLGNPVEGKTLSTLKHSGIISYEPTELVLTARSGTGLQEIEHALSEHKQMLAFEPPYFCNQATLGGTIACNLSGPRRPYTGAARDFVLGTKIINGKAEILSFGGEVMKNVAGYDVSRLQTGAFGALGLLLEISLKVLPKPDYERTLLLELSPEDAQRKLVELNRQALPVTASCFDENSLFLRLSGTEQSVLAAHHLVGGETVDKGQQFWQKLREQQHSFFNTAKPVWRISVAPATPPLQLNGQWLYEWNGALRWLSTTSSHEEIFDVVKKHGGSAVCYRNRPAQTPAFMFPEKALLRYHQKLKDAFDPGHILNPNKMFAGI